MKFWTEQAGPIFVVAFMSLVTGFPIAIATENGVVVRYGVVVEEH